MASSNPAPYKLSFNNGGRASPFRRPSSPLAHSPSTVRAHTPTSSPLKPSTPSPEKPQSPLRNPAFGRDFDLNNSGSATANQPQWRTTRGTTAPPDIDISPTRGLATPSRSAATRPSPIPFDSFESVSATPPPLRVNRPAVTRTTTGSDPLSKLPPQLLHTLRESFSVLDHNNTGSVAAADVADMLTQLGLDASPSAVSAFFADSPTMTLSTYLQTLSSLLAPLSSSQELVAAFEAFDRDDSGQIDMTELKDALLNTAPEHGDRRLTEREIDSVVDGFSGRRAFGKGKVTGSRGEVFRYHEFVANISGSAASDNQTAPQKA